MVYATVELGYCKVACLWIEHHIMTNCMWNNNFVNVFFMQALQ